MRRNRLALVLYGLFLLVCLSSLIWPVYPWVDRTFDFRLFGLPVPFAWNVIWVLGSFVALLLQERFGEQVQLVLLGDVLLGRRSLESIRRRPRNELGDRLAQRLKQ